MHICARIEVSYSDQLSLFVPSMDGSDLLDEVRLSANLVVDDGWAADSDSVDSGEQELNDENEDAEEDNDADEGIAEHENHGADTFIPGGLTWLFKQKTLPLQHCI